MQLLRGIGLLSILLSLTCKTDSKGINENEASTLDFSISGFEFYEKFMKLGDTLKIRNACTSWPLYEQLQTNDIDAHLRETEVEAAAISHGNYGGKKMTIGEFIESEEHGLGFTYSISTTDHSLLSTIEIPVMVSSCDDLYNSFKTSFRANIMASKSKELTEIYALRCFANHTFIAVLSGKVRLTMVGKVPIIYKLKAGDLVYLPPRSCTSIKAAKTSISVILSWNQNLANKDILNCNEPSLRDEDSKYNLQEVVAPDSAPKPLLLTTGFEMPPIGFGTSRLYENTYEAVSNALKIGYRLLDTAQLYNSSDGRSSEIEVGRAIKDSDVPRENLFIVTKTHPDMKPTMKNVVASIEKSLKELQTDYIDLVLIHSPYDEDDCNEYIMSCALNMWAGWDGMLELKKRGKIRSLGVSNVMDNDDLREILKRTDNQVAVIQNYFDPFHQDQAIRDTCKTNGIVYMGYSALGLTWVDNTQGYGMTFNPVLNHPFIKTIGLKTDLPPSTVVLRWAMQNGVVVMPCTTNHDHMETNFYSQQMQFSLYLMSYIDKMDGTFSEEDVEITLDEFNTKFAITKESLAPEEQAQWDDDEDNDYDAEEDEGDLPEYTMGAREEL